VLRHCVRRDSRGWVDVVAEASEEVEVGSDERRVSERPGAEGAPRSVVLVVEVGCEADGAMRRDCGDGRGGLEGWS
jgi:hypothetical protein